MRCENWLQASLGTDERSAAARRRRRRHDEWYVPLQVGRLEDRRVLNAAPTLSGANSLATINKNQSDATNNGTLVSALISGQVSGTPGDSFGIAVTAVDNGHGAWQFSTNGGNNGGTWTDITGLDSTHSLLLAADANNTLVRFQPSNNFTGAVSTGITFRAWDITSGGGSAGSLADASSNGGSTPFSSSTASAGIVVNSPPTISGTGSKSINDGQTTTPFNGVTIGDTDTPAQTLSITLTLSNSANGSLSTASGFTDQGSGVYTFSGTAANATTAIRTIVFTPTAHQAAPGNIVQTTITIAASDGIAPAVSDNGTVIQTTATNTAPSLSGATNLTAINENPTTNNGTLVSTLIGGHITDPDFNASAFEGIAVTGVTTPTGGSWNYSTDGGGTWNPITGVNDGNALLLAANVSTLVQFVPGSNFSGLVTPGITFRAWDQTSGTATHNANTNSNGGTTAFSSATASASILVNDAPVLSGANNLTSIPETPATNTGTLVSDLISGKATDVNGNSLGIAITAADDTNGRWQYSLNGAPFTDISSPSINNALLLPANSNTFVRFMPNNGFFGVVSPGITFFAWDRTSGNAGDMVSILFTDGTTAFSSASFSSAITVSAPPSISGTAAGQTTNDATPISPFSAVTISDANVPADTLTTTVQIGTPANGSFTSASLTGWTTVTAGQTYQFVGSAADTTTAIDTLVFVPMDHQVLPGNSVTTGFTITANNGVATASDNKTTVVATAVNDPPTIMGTSANQAVNDNATIQPFSGVTISDPDQSGEPASVTVTLDNAANGQFTTASTSDPGWTVVDVAHGTYTFSGTRAEAQTALQGLVFVPTAHQEIPGQSVTTHFTVEVDEPPNLSTTDTTTSVVATAINDPPTIMGTTANQAVNDNATIQPFSGVTIVDPDNSAEPATVTITLDHPGNGQFSTASTTDTGWTVDVVDGIYSFSGTRADAQSELQGLVFVPSANQVIPGNTVTTKFTIQVTEGALSTSDNKTSVVATSINDPPTIMGTVANQTMTEDQTLQPFSGVTFVDPDVSDEPATVIISLSDATHGRFSAASTNDTGWTKNVNGGIYTFVGTRAQAETELQGLVFVPKPALVLPGQVVTTQFSIELDEGAISVTNNTTSVKVTAVNHPPQITGTVANQGVNDNGIISPFTGVQIRDPDLPNEPATVTITLDNPANGQFSAASTADTGWTVDVATGTYTFSGARGAAQSELEGLVFVPTANQVVPGSTVTTHFTIEVDEPNIAPVTDTTTSVVATSINDAPTIMGTVANQQVTDATTINPFSGVTIVDPDVSGEPATVTITLNHAGDGQFTTASTSDPGWTVVDVAHGTYTFSGTRADAQTALQGLVFVPTAHQVAPGHTVTTQFTIEVKEPNGGGFLTASDNTTTVVATAINNPPTIVGATAGQAVNDNATLKPFTSVTIVDPDNSSEPATVSITLDHPEDGRFSAASTADAGWTIDVATGVYTFSGTRADAQSALQGLVFVPTNHQVVPGATVTTMFTILVTEPNGTQPDLTASDSTTTVVATAINNPPTIVGTVANVLANDNAPISPLAATTISDPDNSAERAILTVTLDNPLNGQFSAASTADAGWTVNAAAGVYIFDGTRAQAQTEMQRLVFVPTVNPLPGGATATIFTVVVSEPNGPPATASPPVTFKIQTWQISASATPVNSSHETTLTVNLVYPTATQSFVVAVDWGDGSKTATSMDPGSTNLSHVYATNPNASNAAAPIPISVTVTDAQAIPISLTHPTPDPAHTATINVLATVPLQGLGAAAAPPQTTSGETVTPPPVDLGQVQETTNLETVNTQTADVGAAGAEATSNDERLVVLRIVSPQGTEGDDILVPDRALNDLPGMFKNLPDGHYRVYLSEGGRERLVIEVVVRQGRAVDPSDDSGGNRDRPPTSETAPVQPQPVVAGDKSAWNQPAPASHSRAATTLKLTHGAASASAALMRTQSIDDALARLDPRTLSKAARLARSIRQ